ncbi:MAG: glycine zipper family protein, partial [Verrucomicrobiota bacterium]
TVVGAIVGAVAGGLGGKAAGEAVDPTAEDAYWRENHAGQTYSSRGQYDDFSPAYRTGYEGYAAHSGEFNSFEEAEPRLRDRYSASNPRLTWEEARDASRAAWSRLQQNRSQQVVR